MRPKFGLHLQSAEQVVKDMRRANRKHHAAEDRIKNALEGLPGEYSIAEMCRREGMALE